MTRNPIINAISALAYIGLVVALITFVSHTQANKPDTVFAPFAALTLFTLSAVVMAYLFFYQPMQLFIDGKKKVAVNLFLKTAGIFAVFTAVIWALLIFGII